jgi:peptidoglycan/LPS O-acetylase OafA/YrhL
MAAGSRVLVNLQICRALAAVMVVLGHGLHDAQWLAAHGHGTAEIQPNWGVDVFFVISGFIMVHVSAGDFAEPGAPWRFLRRRLARIVPLYWTLTTLLIVGSLWAPGLLNVPTGSVAHIVDSYLFIPDWRADMSAMRPVMALGWTLNYEMLFYVFFAASMFLPFQRAVALLTALFAAAVAANAAFHVTQSQLSYWMDPLILEFLFGVYLAIAYRARLRLGPVSALVLAAVALAALGSGAIGTVFPAVEDVRTISFGLAAALLVAAAALGPALPDWRAVRLATALGDASYALYLVHPFVIRPLRAIFFKLPALPLQIFCPLALSCAVIAAFVVHHVFERPVTRLLQGRCRPNAGERDTPPGIDTNPEPPLIRRKAA